MIRLAHNNHRSQALVPLRMGRLLLLPDDALSCRQGTDLTCMPTNMPFKANLPVLISYLSAEGSLTSAVVSDSVALYSC